jgi:dephospho-CoA kinase
MKLIALTGGIGSGKSTVASKLSQLGYCVFDADIFARDVLYYQDVENKIKSIFGDDIFLSKGQLNREAVGKMIYSNPLLKQKLENIMHPAIANEFKTKTDSIAKLAPDAWVFYEASLILELGKKEHFDACVVVKTHPTHKKDRLFRSRNMTHETFDKITSTQMPDEDKIKHADYIIENSGNLENLQLEIFNLIRFLYKKFTPSSF